jgi:hypothetical protein
MTQTYTPIHAALIGHYGKSAEGATIQGVSLTVKGVDWTFKQGFTRMLKAYLRAIALKGCE